MANQVTTTFSINAAQALSQLAAYQQQLRNTIQLQTQLGNAGANTGGGGGGTGGSLAIGAGLGGWIAGAVSTAAVISAVKTATAAVKENEAANRALAASAVEAGKSYLQLAESSKAFGEAALISESAAARSTAQLQRLLTLAGQPDQLEKYQKGFLDLAAARGVAFDELDTLFQGIIAGTDDALNRFGKQDPSKLAEQYAKSIGKTVEQLTEQEKILSRLQAFDKDFGLFNGANEARINSFSGSVDRLNKSIDDIVTNFGNWAAQTRVVRDNIGALQLLLGGGGLSNDESVRKMIEQGLSDEQILKALGGGQGPGWYDRLVAGWSKSPGGVIGRLIFGGNAVSAEEVAGQQDAFTMKQIAAVRKQVDIETQGAAQGAAQSRTDRFRTELKASMDAWMAEVEARRKANAEAAKAEEDRIRRTKEAMRSVREMIVGIEAQRNPFVSVFESGYQSLVKVYELTKNLGGQLRGLAVDAVQRQVLQSYENARISSALQSFNLRSSAADFRSGIDLEGLSPQAAAFRRQRQLRGQLSAIGVYEAAPTMQVLPSNATPAQRRKAEEDYRRAQEAYEIRRAGVDRQIIDLTQGLNPARLDRETRDLAAGAREREAARVAEQEREARNLFKSLQGIINPDGIKVVIGSGQQIVRIIDESDRAEVVQRPGTSSVGNRYGS